MRLHIEGRQVNMKLDTGSALSIMNTKDYETLFPHVPLEPANLTLKTYTGQKVRPKGKFTVRYRKKQFPNLDVYVLTNGGPPLLGREWIRRLQLDLNTIHTPYAEEADTEQPVDKVNTTQATDDTPTRLASILATAADVFQDGFGTLKGMQARIMVAEHATPTFC